MTGGGPARYPAGTQLFFSVGASMEDGDIALARLSTGKEGLGIIEDGRFARRIGGGHAVTFEIPEPAAAHVVPCLRSVLPVRALRN
jgi:hypothetical protein